MAQSAVSINLAPDEKPYCHPSIVAQSFATPAQLSQGPVFFGIGTGEAMDELPATGDDWPGAKERRLRLAESIGS